MIDTIIVKRDGSEVPFERQKIICAVEKALLEVDGNLHYDYLAENTARSVESYLEKFDPACITVEEIQDLVEQFLIDGPKPELAKSYIRYRYKREMAREQYKKMMESISEKLNAENVQNQNANVDEYSFGGRIGEMSELVCKQYALDFIVSPMAKENHLNNEIYIHDLGAYAVGSHNCLTIPFDDLLAKGFNTRQTDVRPAQSVSTAFQLVAVIFQLQSLQQFGGVSASHIDWTMVPYVRKSFWKHWRDGCEYVLGINVNKYDGVITNDTSIEDGSYKTFNEAYNYALAMTEREVYQAVEAMYHNLNTLQSRSGNQLK